MTLLDYELPEFLARLSAVAVVLVLLWAANWFLLRRNRDMGEERRFSRRIIMTILAVVGIVIILVALPVYSDMRDPLVALVGLIITAAIALSSTTFVSNAMAGLMLRAVQSFRSGDFVSVGDHFGRVTERGLFHTEIQTEDRDLTTLPNLYLVSNPLKVVRYSGTIVSATVSLGYDLPHQQIRTHLLQAARDAKLEDPFVQILDLGDFSITYRVAGFLREVKQMLTARSNLRSLILDTLHGAGIEIVSPSVMNQRRLSENDRLLPPESSLVPDTIETKTNSVPEQLIFDKAEAAERLEQLGIEQGKLAEEIEKLESSLKEADEHDRPRLESQIKQRRSRTEEIARQLKAGEE